MKAASNRIALPAPTLLRQPLSQAHSQAKSRIKPRGTCVRVASRDGAEIPAHNLMAIEQFDDVVFNALKGDAEALDKVQPQWRQLQRRLPPALLAESQEQYVRSAQTAVRRHRQEPASTLGKAFAAFEILALMAYE